MTAYLKTILTQFRLLSPTVSCERYGFGHINETYLVVTQSGVRFLTDYLDGDHYFATHRPGQNLDRTRTQFKLVADMEQKWEQMHHIVRQCTE